MHAVPEERIRKCNRAEQRPRGEYVLYWMIASRRLHYNFALDRSLEHCVALGKPLVILEALRIRYEWACDRFHRFVLDGMADNLRTCKARGVCYYPYVEPVCDAGKGLLAAFADRAAVVVTDDYPCFFFPRMVASAAQQLPVLLEAVESNGLLPIYANERVALRAFDFRRYLQKELPKYLEDFPRASALARVKLPSLPAVSRRINDKWPMVSSALLAGKPGHLNSLKIDHAVKPAPLTGGHAKARAQMLRFFSKGLPLYSEQRNEPEREVASGLSPYLHFGHLSVHEIFAELARREKWNPGKISLRTNGSREGWWGMLPNTESFLDELITWRELGYNFAAHRKDYGRYESLPQWVQTTLAEHVRDEREHVYTLEEFEAAVTHDPLWNAAQTQLVREGRIHSYLRMVWGKKILQWTRSPREAVKVMIHLNNKYALDGRDPNSYSGIFWVLGRYDRPWAPIRQVFGSIRYMSSENTARKVSVKNYIRRYASGLGGPKESA